MGPVITYRWQVDVNIRGLRCLPPHTDYHNTLEIYRCKIFYWKCKLGRCESVSANPHNMILWIELWLLLIILLATHCTTQNSAANQFLMSSFPITMGCTADDIYSNFVQTLSSPPPSSSISNIIFTVKCHLFISFWNNKKKSKIFIYSQIWIMNMKYGVHFIFANIIVCSELCYWCKVSQRPQQT